VQVTRSTFVGEHPGNGDRNSGYDGGYGQEWSTVVPRSRPPEDYGESWTDEKLRERYGGRRPRPYDRLEDRDGERPGGPTGRLSDSWRGSDDRWPPASAAPASAAPASAAPASAAPVSRGRRRFQEDGPDSYGGRAEPAGRRDDSAAVRGGERWAAVRSDERGSELRVGERRASRHSDERGSELRIEDRWAAVRRDAGLDSESGGYDSADARPDYRRPALPATSSEPSWNDIWEEPERQSRGHRYRPDDDDSYGGGRQRRLDFELTDERWR
jgi:hypothetical protein